MRSARQRYRTAGGGRRRASASQRRLFWRETIVTDLHATFPLRSVGCAIALEDVYEHIVLAK
jgi:hypothetical protein